MTSLKPSRRKKVDLAPNSEAFRLLFANHPIPMWIYDLKSLAFLDVNDAALEKYGYTRDEFLARTLKDIRPTDAKRVERLINDLEQKRMALQHSGEWRHCLKNGQIIDVEITSHTLEFEGHNAVLLMAQDVTERNQAEKSLRHNRDLLFALSLASQSVQQARTTEDVYRAVGREIKALGYDLAIFTLSADRRHLTTTYATFVTGLLRAAEKLTGVRTKEYHLPIQLGSVFERVVDGERAEFLDQTAADAAQVLPNTLRPLAEQLVTFLKVDKGIVAPLRVDDITLGVLTVTGSKLEEGDVPSVEAFAAQIAISLKNAQLTQQVQEELDERKQAEKALQDSELRFRSLIEHGRDNISLLAADGSLLWESPAVVHALGYEYDHFRGRNIFELMHPDDMERAQLRFSEIVSKPGSVIPDSFRLRHSNGSWRWMQGISTNLLHEPSINAVVINYRDITESRQAEDFLQESARSLARAQRIGKLGDWDWDVEGNSLTWSDETYRILGVGKDFALTFENIAGMIHPDDRELNSKMVQEFLAQSNEGEFEFRIICPDGTIKYIYQSIEVTRSPDGQPIKMFGIMQDITKRKQAEEALRESEERLRLANKATNDVIWDWDIVNDSQRWNEAGTVVFGWRDIVESPQPATWWLERVHPEDRQRVENSFFVVTTDPARNYWHDEYRFRKMDGSYAQVIDRGYVLRNAQGEAVRMIGAMLDITERKQTEEALRETSERLAHMLANSPTVIYALKVEGENAIPAWISDNINAVLGFSVEDGLQPEWWSHQIRPEDRAGALASLEHLFDDFYQHEYRFLHKDGRLIWLHDEHRLLRNENNKPREIIGAWTDITERKQTEEAFRESEERFRTLVVQAPTAIFIQTHGQFAYINKAGLTLFGAESEDQLLGQPVLDRFHPKVREQVLERIRQLNELGKEVPNAEETIIKLDVSYAETEVSAVPFYFKGDHGALVFVRDITERKQAEQKLAQYSEHLEEMVEARTSELREAQEKIIRNEKLAVLGQLAGGVGHELRNPLAVINNALYYLKLIGANGNEKVKEYLGIIQTEAHTAEKIITDLLDFARIKSVDLEPVSVSKLTARVLERYPAPKAVSLRLEIPEDLPKLYVDPRQMEQVLGNLVINACQAMKSSGGELTVTAQRQQEMVAIAVRDTGVGISPENMKKLFEPLFTTKAKGIGLGLAVSQKLAEANGGRIEVESEAGVGSTFTLVLPVHKG